MFYFTPCPSPLGTLTLACDGEGEALAGLWIEGQKYFLEPLTEMPEHRDDLPIFRQARSWLERYFAGEKPRPEELRLAPMGSSFRQQVWQALCRVPYGRTVTYGQLAAEVAAQRGEARGSPRAVGGAVGHNPISIVIPCHRVMGAGGALTGYAGGIERKRWLLEHEGVGTSGFRPPAKAGGI